MMTQRARASLPAFIPCPQLDSNRHWADFENGIVAFYDQRKQVAEPAHIACKAADVLLAGMVAVRLRYG